jgi:hypothetical protein
MSHRDERVALEEYYETISTVQLVEIYLSKGLTELADSILTDELLNRGIEPKEITKEYLDTLVQESGRTEGIDALSYRHPIFIAIQRCLDFILNKNGRLKEIATKHPILFSLILVAILPYLLYQ